MSAVAYNRRRVAGAYARGALDVRTHAKLERTELEGRGRLSADQARGKSPVLVEDRRAKTIIAPTFQFRVELEFPFVQPDGEIGGEGTFENTSFFAQSAEFHFMILVGASDWKMTIFYLFVGFALVMTALGGFMGFTIGTTGRVVAVFHFVVGSAYRMAAGSLFENARMIAPATAIHGYGGTFFTGGVAILT